MEWVISIILILITQWQGADIDELKARIKRLERKIP